MLCKKKTLFGDTKKVADVVAKEEQTGVAGYVSRQLDQDIHASIKESEYVSAIHDNAEKFDPRTEEAFKYVQVSYYQKWCRTGNARVWNHLRASHHVIMLREKV